MLILRTLGVAAAAMCLATPAPGTCPDDLEPPVSLGSLLGLGAADPAMVTSPDGATWTAWLDDQCFGSLRVQRLDPDGSVLVPGGITLDTREDCLSREPHLAACADGSVVACGVAFGASTLGTPVQRIDAGGVSLWGDGVLVAGESLGGVGSMLGIPGGDALIAWHQGTVVFVGRYAPDGTTVWTTPIPTVSGSNKRIFALRSDDADGAFVLWDEPLTYTRVIWAMRVTGSGQAAWTTPLVAVPGQPGSSRHTDPVAIEDGAGGLVLVWTQGAESADTIVPLRMQRIAADGTTGLEVEGRRISLETTRQFDASVGREAASGDVLIAWRDGGLHDQTLRAQRMTLAGARVWGDDGVAVTPLETPASRFDTAWNAGTLTVVVSDTPADPDGPRVRVHRVDATGVVAAPPCPVSGSTPTGVALAVASGDDVVAAWFEDTPATELVARRIAPGGPIPGDANGDGVVDVNDVVSVILDWGTDGSAHGGDVNGDGIVNVDDLVAVILQWSS